MDYGTDVGMISLIVFEGLTEEHAMVLLSEEEQAATRQVAMKLPAETADSNGDLQQTLLDELLDQEVRGGLIVQGDKQESKVKNSKFKRATDPVMAASIRYYNPK